MHGLILGIINTGKTTLAIQIAKQQVKRREVIWYSPIRDPRLNFVSLFISDREKFLALVTNPKFKNALIVFDESSQTLPASDKEASAFVVVARHAGHQLLIIAQRASQVNKTAREQCSQAFVFRQGPDDAELLARQFSEPRLRECPNLKKGEYLHVISTEGIWKGDLKLK